MPPRVIAKELFALVSRASCLQLFGLLLIHCAADICHTRFFLILADIRGIIAERDKRPLASTRRWLHEEVLRINLNQRARLAALLGEAEVIHEDALYDLSASPPFKDVAAYLCHRCLLGAAFRSQVTDDADGPAT